MIFRKAGTWTVLHCNARHCDVPAKVVALTAVDVKMVIYFDTKLFSPVGG
jgi:hypothetical protein